MAWTEQNSTNHGIPQSATLTSQDLHNLSNLRILALPSNRLREISPGALQPLTNLEELYLSHNDLTSISGLDGNLRLRILDVSDNDIAHLSNLSHLTHLEEFWASGNLIGSFEEVATELGGLQKLHTVYFEHNPLQDWSRSMYRSKLQMILRNIKQIDATYCTSWRGVEGMFISTTQVMSSGFIMLYSSGTR
jgi:protein phosphatase 1 regulatory subunit 7